MVLSDDASSCEVKGHTILLTPIERRLVALLRSRSRFSQGQWLEMISNLIDGQRPPVPIDDDEALIVSDEDDNDDSLEPWVF